jgi:hypothetical protein
MQRAETLQALIRRRGIMSSLRKGNLGCGEPDAVKSCTSGSEGGRRKSAKCNSPAPYPTLTHQGEQVKHALDQRRGVRRSRRQRHTRYRKPRFRNRKRKPGWQPPSRLSRVQNVLTWAERLRHWCPIGWLSQELVRFDTQRMQQPEISGVEYQQGALAGYELRQYLAREVGESVCVLPCHERALGDPRTCCRGVVVGRIARAI